MITEEVTGSGDLGRSQEQKDVVSECTSLRLGSHGLRTTAGRGPVDTPVSTRRDGGTRESRLEGLKETRGRVKDRGRTTRTKTGPLSVVRGFTSSHTRESTVRIATSDLCLSRSSCLRVVTHLIRCCQTPRTSQSGTMVGGVSLTATNDTPGRTCTKVFPDEVHAFVEITTLVGPPLGFLQYTHTLHNVQSSTPIRYLSSFYRNPSKDLPSGHI